MKAGELREYGFFSGVKRNILTASCEDLTPLAVNVLPLHQERHRLAARVQRTADDERTFRNEKRMVRVCAVE